MLRISTMGLLGNGLHESHHLEDALSVRETNLSMLRRIGASQELLLTAQNNLAISYEYIGRREQALLMRRDVYSGWLKLKGEESRDALMSANNYAASLIGLERYQEVKSLMRKMLPVARRVLGESHDVTLRMQWIYARPLYSDTNATLGELRAAVKTLEEAEGIARRVLGASNPLAGELETALQDSRTALARKSSS